MFDGVQKESMYNYPEKVPLSTFIDTLKIYYDAITKKGIWMIGMLIQFKAV